MRAQWPVLVVPALAALVLGAGWAAQAQQRRWAALDPNRETTSPVAWGASEEEARKRAIEACQRVSGTCAKGPASTDNLREVFALACCARPKLACAAAAAAGRREAARNATETLAAAGYSDCSVRRYISAATGKRL